MSMLVLGISAYSFFYPVYDYALLGVTVSYMAFCLYYIKTRSRFKSTKIKLGIGKGELVKI